MTGLEVALAVAGAVVTLLVIAGMILITPHGEVDVEEGAPRSQGSELSRAATPDRPGRASPKA